MTSHQFEQLKLSRIIAFRREAKAQRIEITDEDMQELERRLEVVRKAMGPSIHTDEQLPGCWVATTDNYDGPGSPIGSGFSEQDAIDDLLDKLEGD